MAKTINITDIKIHEVTLLKDEEVLEVVYSLISEDGNEWTKKRTKLTKKGFTLAQIVNLTKVFQLLKPIIKNKEKI